MSDIITLTTDFGTNDAYVASMKGVILSLNPKVQIVDICHNISPQSISQAAFVLDTVYPLFPGKTIHIVVVDPGVGTERQAIVLRTPVADFVAPDNGVLSYVIELFCDEKMEEKGVVKAKLNREIEAVTVTNKRFLRSPVSNTFHGRDIFAPVAAHLSRGEDPFEMGKSIGDPTSIKIPIPRQNSDALIGQVIRMDHFGNLITNIGRKDLLLFLGASLPVIKIGGLVIKGLRKTYSDAKEEELLALIGSSDSLEIAVNLGSACDRMKLALEDIVGMEVQVGKMG